MKKKLSFKKIFSLAWSDLVGNVKDWLLLLGLQLMSLSLLATILYTFYFFISLSSMVSFGQNLFFLFIVFFITCMVAMMILYPIMNRQNALDVAFKRRMSGFDMNNRFFTFALAMFIYGLITGLTTFLFFLGLFLAQRWKFVGLHLLEHGGTIRQAFKASWRMTRGYVWFFIGISIIEWLFMIMISWTIIGYFIAVIMNYLIDAHIYKQLHMEVDKDIATCSSCEN